MTPAVIHKQALERFQHCHNSSNDWRIKALFDLKFSAGGKENQWDPVSLVGRGDRPTLVVNKMTQFVRQITGEQRQNPTSVKVNPVDDRSDPDVAEVLQGTIRHVEVTSGAQAAYQTAFEHCVKMGKGWWRVDTEYDDETSFNLRLLINRILNPFSIYEDPAAQKPDFSDMKFLFVSEEISFPEHERRWPGKNPVGLQEFRSVGDDLRLWAPEEGKVRVAEYWYQDTKKHQLLGGVISFRSGAEQKVMLKADELEQAIPEGAEWKETHKREVEVKAIKKAMINGEGILKEIDWAGKYIPFIPVIGDELILNGERDYRGIIRDAIDPQRIYNYGVSKRTEVIAQTPHVPWLGPKGFVKGMEKLWRGAVTRSTDWLEYNVIDFQGKPLPPPSRNAVEPPIQAITLTTQASGSDLEDVVGLHGPSLGRRERADSGKAILALQREGQTGNYHFVDNLSRAHRHSGIVLIDMIIKTYDVKRIGRIIGEDDQERRVEMINDPEEKAVIEGQDEEGKAKKIFNVGVGRYDIAITTGASYATKRQEGLTAIMELVKNYPPIGEVGADILVKLVDTPYAQELSERIKKTLDPGMIEDGDDPIPARASAEISQLKQELETLTALMKEVEAKGAELEDVIDKKRIEADTKIKVKEMENDMAVYKEQVKIAMADDQITAGERLELLRRETALQAKPSASNGNSNPNVGG